ncbi:NusG domain II-containing protein [Dechloromonas denitrificans]|uniref:NusG domain II-containing protein n=1 Tax=Dechloromonas denitrificans TaxID=281362 RepID=UPI0039AF79B1
MPARHAHSGQSATALAIVPWLSLIRPGDWLVILAGTLLVGTSIPLFWQGGMADRAIIRQEGKVFAEVDLRSKRQFEISGPLGTTLIAVEPGRVRVVSDPGPRQYCVRQGWLMRPGEIAICAPNRVSVQITGRTKVYDSINY